MFTPNLVYDYSFIYVQEIRVRKKEEHSVSVQWGMFINIFIKLIIFFKATIIVQVGAQNVLKWCTLYTALFSFLHHLMADILYFTIFFIKQ